MKRLLQIIIGAALMAACSPSYDETLDTGVLSIVLDFPETMQGGKDGVRVELKSIGHDAVFVDSTDVQGVAHFRVTPGIYEASTSAVYVDSTGTTWWRYVFNGIKSQIVVAPDSLNQVEMQVKVSRKRVVH